MAKVIRTAALALGLVLFALRANAQTPELVPATYQEIQAALAESDARVKVVNFWATWCGPCREEFPAFVQLGRDLAEEGVAVVFVSMDFEDEQAAAEAFLAEQGWTEPSFLRTGSDHDFINAFHEDWTGALPATLIYDANGALISFHEGRPFDYATLRAEVDPLLAD